MHDSDEESVGPMDDQFTSSDSSTSTKSTPEPQRLHPLGDNDLFPFGQPRLRNQSMKDVRASYYHFLWENGLKGNDIRGTQGHRVADYIRRNMKFLQKENKDLIWSAEVKRV